MDIFSKQVPQLVTNANLYFVKRYVGPFQVQSIYGDDEFGPSNNVEADTKCEPTELPPTTQMSTTPEPPLPPFSNISVSEAVANATLLGETLSCICLQDKLLHRSELNGISVSWQQRRGESAKVKIFDDVSGEEEEADIVVPDEAEEEELLQYKEFMIRPCRLYEVRAMS